MLAGILVLMPLAVYLLIQLGFAPMATTAKPLPFERTLAHMALRQDMRGAAATKDPLPMNEANLLAGAQIYKVNCAVCHGLPGQPKTPIAKGMFPDPPQLFENDSMVTDDPEGVTYWKVNRGIRLSGMPGFGSSLSEQQQWQVTMLVAHADKLPDAVHLALK